MPLRPGGLVFGSEVKAVLEHPAVERDLDERTFFDYLTFAFTPPPATMYRGVSKLAPAERLIVRADGSLEHSTYWSAFSPEVSAAVRAMSEEEQVQRLRDLLRESIRKRIMSDVPFGVFLPAASIPRPTSR
jgi:asparagine synthase (glutamine-hydrolysing)